MSSAYKTSDSYLNPIDVAPYGEHRSEDLFVSDADGPPGTDVPALRKGRLVLELLADGGALTMAEVQQRGGLNKTMAFRILRALREHGLVQRDTASHRYSLSLKVLALGGVVAARLDVVSVSRPLLEDLRLEFQETINLGVMDDGHVVYAAMVESSRRGLRMSSHLGGRDHLHSTSIGKAMLAFLPEERLEAMLATVPRPRLTPRTITDLVELRAELTRTRQRGYAIDNEENEIGARCVGVPILDSKGVPLAGLSVSGPSNRIDDARIGIMALGLWQASTEISRRLGHATPHPEIVSKGPDGSGSATHSAALPVAV